MLETAMLLGVFWLAPAAVVPGEMVEVPAGSFRFGSDTGDADERPVRVVRHGRFFIDRTEVTRAAYRQCVAAGACRAARHYGRQGGDRLPVVGVTWEDAARYCRWRGKRLPTEIEWERAARGTDGRTYPWGRGLDCRRANFGNFAGDGPCPDNPGRVAPVGSRPRGRSPAGADDMAGNAWEWVADKYGDGPKKRSLPARAPVRRVLRGGSCCSYFAMPTTTNRLPMAPMHADFDIGFRCARSASTSDR